jgi:hypothetical protein
MGDSHVEKLPFERFSFTLVEDKRPRAALRLSIGEQGMYELHVEKGSASNPISQFTRQVPSEVAQRLKDNLQDIGVFAWEESYGDSIAPGQRRWSVTTVFKEGVFSVASRGGSDTPAGFDQMLEELYRLDFPRPNGPKAPSAQADSHRFDGMGADFAQIADLMKSGDLGGADLSEMFSVLEQARSDPYALQARMRDEFKRLPPDEQEKLLDALASAGGASRAWWERFLRG